MSSDVPSETSAEHMPPHQPSASTFTAEHTASQNATITSELMPPGESSSVMLNGEHTAPQNAVEDMITTEHVLPEGSSSSTITTGPMASQENSQTSPVPVKLFPMTLSTVQIEIKKVNIFAIPHRRESDGADFIPMPLRSLDEPDDEDEANDTSLSITPETTKVSPFCRADGRKLAISSEDEISPFDPDIQDAFSLQTSKSDQEVIGLVYGPDTKVGGSAYELHSKTEENSFNSNVDDEFAVDFQNQIKSTVQLDTKINKSTSSPCSGIYNQTNDPTVSTRSFTVVNSRSTSTSDNNEDVVNLSSPLLFETDKNDDQSACSDNFSLTSSMTMFLRSPIGSEYDGFDDCISVRSLLSDSDNEYHGVESISKAFKLGDDPDIAYKPIEGRCLLLAMPLKVRHLIYSYCFPPKKNRALICPWNWSQQPPSFTSNVRDIWPPILYRAPAFDPAIFLLNNRIFTEVAALFYACHTFRFTTCQLENCYFESTIFSWLRNIEIEDMRARFGVCRVRSVLEQLSAKENVRNIFVGTRAAHRLCDPEVSWMLPWIDREATDPQPAVPSWLQLKPRIWPALPKVVLVEFRVPVARAQRRG